MDTDILQNLIFYKFNNINTVEIFTPEKSTGNNESLKKEIIDNNSFKQKSQNSNIVYSPNFLDAESTLVITSKCLEEIMPKIFPNNPSDFIYVPGYIDLQGKIVEPFGEAEMNRVLKQVFASKTKKILVHLFNGAKNQEHEKMFYNVLTVAGYKVYLSSF